MSNGLRLRQGADETLRVLATVAKFRCYGNGQATTSSGFERADARTEFINQGEDHLVEYDGVGASKAIVRRFCAACTRKFLYFAVE